jgi:choline kinase
MVLAAGAGRRLESLTEDLPKTLLPVDGDRTILDIALRNLSRADMETVVVVTGYAAERIEERREALEQRHGVAVETLFNPKAEAWNNCYSLWCAREHFGRGVLLCNGDSVHPPEVEERLLAGRGHSDLLLALDDVKALGEEEMKVLLDGDGRMRGINKAHDPAEAAGEYIGLTLIEPAASEGLAEALEATWRRDPSLYYEDGFQEYADRGGRVGVASVGGLEWVEVDDQHDLEKAREMAWRC